MDDALAATRATVEEGIVPGGGCIHSSYCIFRQIKGVNEDENTGIIVRRAIEEPLRQIVLTLESKRFYCSAKSKRRKR